MRFILVIIITTSIYFNQLVLCLTNRSNIDTIAVNFTQIDPTNEIEGSGLISDDEDLINHQNNKFKTRPTNLPPEVLQDKQDKDYYSSQFEYDDLENDVDNQENNDVDNNNNDEMSNTFPDTEYMDYSNNDYRSGAYPNLDHYGDTSDIEDEINSMTQKELEMELNLYKDVQLAENWLKDWKMSNCMKSQNGIMGKPTFTILVLVPSEAATIFKFSKRFIRPAIDLAKEEAEDLIRQKHPQILKNFNIQLVYLNSNEDNPRFDISNGYNNNLSPQILEERGHCEYQVVQFNWMILNEINTKRDMFTQRQYCNPKRTHNLAGVIGPVGSSAASGVAKILKGLKTLQITPGLISEHFLENKEETHSTVVRTGPTGRGFALSIIKFLNYHGWTNKICILFRRADRQHIQYHQPIGDSILRFKDVGSFRK